MTEARKTDEELLEMPMRIPCGRPTQKGTPCKKEIPRWDLACELHADERDKIASQAAWEAYRLGHLRGVRSVGDRERLAAYNEEKVRLQAEEERKSFTFHRDGRQVVCVGSYAYLAPSGVDVSVGQKVLLPPDGIFHTSAHWESVTSLGTSYSGDLKQLLGVD